MGNRIGVASTSATPVPSLQYASLRSSFSSDDVSIGFNHDENQATCEDACPKQQQQESARTVILSNESLDYKLVQRLASQYSSYLEHSSCLKQQRRQKKKKNQRKNTANNAIDPTATTIQHLELRECSLGLDYQHDRFTKALIQFLKQPACQRLQVLIITGPMLLETNAQALPVIGALESLPTLRELQLCIGQTANVALGTALAQLLMRTTSLQRLDLRHTSWNKTAAMQELGRGIAKAISPNVSSRATATARSLQHLDLSHCRITDEGFHNLTRALVQEHQCNNANRNIPLSSSSSSLKTLILKQNRLTNTCWKDLTKVIALQTSLKKLVMDGNPLLFANNDDDDDVAKLKLLFQVMTRPRLCPQDDGADDAHENMIANNDRAEGLDELHLAETGMVSSTMQILLEQIGDTSQGDWGQTEGRGEDARLKLLNLNCNDISGSQAMSLIVTYLPKLPQTLHSIFLVPSCYHDPANHKDLTRSFITTLHGNSHLTHLQLLLVTEGSRNNSCNTPDDQMPVNLHPSIQMQAIVQRNQLARRLNAMMLIQHNEELHSGTAFVPLAVWPNYLAKTLAARPSLRSNPTTKQRHAAHPPSLVYQVMHFLVPTMSEPTAAPTIAQFYMS